MIFTVVPSGRHDPTVLLGEIARLRSRDGVLSPRMAPVDGIAKRVILDEHFFVFPVIVIGTPEKDPDPQMDLHEIGGEEFSVQDDTGSDKHLSPPIGHVPVIEIALLWILK